MNLKQQIIAWLDQSDSYETGIDLFQQAGGRGIVLRTLQLGKNAFNRTRLENELSKWLTTHEEPTIVLPIGGTVVGGKSARYAVGNSETVPTVPLTLSMDYGVSDSEVILLNSPTGDYLREQAYDLMNERAEYKAQIRAHKDDPTRQPDRHDWAFRILELTDQIDAIYDKLEFMAEYGYPPTNEEPPKEQDDAALLKNVSTYVSKYKGKLRNPKLTPEQRQSFQTLYDQYEAEKQRLKLKLSKPNDSHTSGQQTSDCPIDSKPLSRA